MIKKIKVGELPSGSNIGATAYAVNSIGKSVKVPLDGLTKQGFRLVTQEVNPNITEEARREQARLSLPLAERIVGMTISYRKTEGTLRDVITEQHIGWSTADSAWKLASNWQVLAVSTDVDAKIQRVETRRQVEKNSPNIIHRHNIKYNSLPGEKYSTCEMSLKCKFGKILSWDLSGIRQCVKAENGELRLKGVSPDYSVVSFPVRFDSVKCTLTDTTLTITDPRVAEIKTIYLPLINHAGYTFAPNRSLIPVNAMDMKEPLAAFDADVKDLILDRDNEGNVRAIRHRYGMTLDVQFYKRCNIRTIGLRPNRTYAKRRFWSRRFNCNQFYAALCAKIRIRGISNKKRTHYSDWGYYIIYSSYNKETEYWTKKIKKA